MAKVTGPLHSDTASGSFAKAMVFSTWNGRPYTRELVTPKNPRSARQTGVRAMFAFLAAIWRANTGAEWAGWTADAAANGYSTFNAFMKANMKRWQNFQAPSQAYPAAEASTPLTVATLTTTGGSGQVNVSAAPSAATDAWGIAILRSDAEITTPDWSQCVAVIPTAGTDAVSIVDTPLTAGTYHYRAAVINTDGILGTVIADQTAVVT